MRVVKCAAGQRTCICRPIGGGTGRDIVFQAAANNGGTVSGKIERRKRGFFGLKSEFSELQPENSYRMGMMDRGYALFAIPDQDLEVRFLTGFLDRRDVLKWVLIVLGGFMALGILTSLVQNLLGIAPPSP